MVFFTKYYSGDQIKNNEMGGTCGTYGEQERCIGYRVLVGKHEGKRPLENLGADGRKV